MFNLSQPRTAAALNRLAQEIDSMLGHMASHTPQDTEVFVDHARVICERIGRESRVDFTRNDVRKQALVRAQRRSRQCGAVLQAVHRPPATAMKNLGEPRRLAKVEAPRQARAAAKTEALRIEHTPQGFVAELKFAGPGGRMAADSDSVAFTVGQQTWCVELTQQDDGASEAGIWLYLVGGDPSEGAFNFTLVGQRRELCQRCEQVRSWQPGGRAAGFSWTDFGVSAQALCSCESPWLQADGSLLCRVEVLR
jgi:hypothetical protein